MQHEKALPGRSAGKIAVVTGGNSGIGPAAAKRFAKEGASVVIAGRNAATLEEAWWSAATFRGRKRCKRNGRVREGDAPIDQA